MNIVTQNQENLIIKVDKLGSFFFTKKATMGNHWDYS
jgi:hypothetical protein